MKTNYYQFLFGLVFFLAFETISMAQKLESEFLYKIQLTLANPIDIGKLPIGQRVIYPVTGGSFEGPKIKGKVRAFGADWVLRLDSVTTKLDVKLLLETHDGQLISKSYSGIVHTRPDGSTYWRIAPVFETSSKQYNWLNHRLAVGIGSTAEGGVAYEVFVIK